MYGGEIMRHDIVPAHLAVKAMRDNGYKNAAYAIAELIDNSIQAGATKVELICCEDQKSLRQRTRSQIEKIAVLDNGSGMNADTLRQALQFGNGNYLDYEKHTGMGRFGMGLPCSSMSQCKRVDVWSWQNGKKAALHTYLDLDEICSGDLSEVPSPKSEGIPEPWASVGESFGKSGTLVVWSNIDRCMWRSAKTIIDHSELIIGRMYRKFLENNKVSIKMTSFLQGGADAVKSSLAVANDPIYLMEKTSCPFPYHDTPMFKPWGEEHFEAVFPVEYQGDKHEVKVRYTYAKEEAREIPNAGKEPHGKHAEKNVGVSIVRADRELALDDGWRIKYNPTERWWGVEIDFPPALDDIFGVTNNKQAAHYFSELAQLDFDILLKGGRSIQELKDEWDEDGDPRSALVEIAQQIHSNLRVIRGLLKAQTSGTRSVRYATSNAENIATTATRERQKEGFQGESDIDENLPVDRRQKEVEEFLIEEGVADKTASDLSKIALLSDSPSKYLFAVADLETAAFFSVKPKGGVIIVTLNSRHPAYDKLVHVLEGDDEGDPQIRLNQALDGLKLLLTAWARYEDEQPDGQRRERAQDARSDWGRIARQFLQGE